MKVLGIVGSKRKNGNTAILVQTALKAIQQEEIDTEIIYLGDYNISDCSGCEGCRDTCHCVVDDGMQQIYPLLWEADAIILGSPTYFYNVTADVKAFIDRCYCFEMFDKEDRSVWMGINEVLGGKYAVVIAVCEQNAEEDMGYTAEAMARPLEALGYRIIEKVKALRLYKRGAAMKDGQALDQALSAGRKLAKTLKLRSRLEKQFKKPVEK